MSEILLYYKRPDPTTWVYLSSFLTIGLFFVFHRFWSIRNLDIVLLILLAPGLLMVHEGYRRQLSESEAITRQRALDPEGQLPENKPVNLRATAVNSLLGAVPIFAVAQVDGANGSENGESAHSASSRQYISRQSIQRIANQSSRSQKRTSELVGDGLPIADCTAAW